MNELYKIIYTLNQKIPKRDRFGLHAKIESLCLDSLELVTTAAFEAKEHKREILHTARIKIEILKRLIRNEYELKIVTEKAYLDIEQRLQEISKMTTGWIKYLQQ